MFIATELGFHRITLIHYNNSPRIQRIITFRQFTYHIMFPAIIVQQLGRCWQVFLELYKADRRINWTMVIFWKSAVTTEDYFKQPGSENNEQQSIPGSSLWIYPCDLIERIRVRVVGLVFRQSIMYCHRTLVLGHK